MKLHASGEDYLESILILKNRKGFVRSIDVAVFMNYSKPSVSHAVSLLRDGGFIMVDDNGYLDLTSAGKAVAEKIYERHVFFKRCFFLPLRQKTLYVQINCRNNL